MREFAHRKKTLREDWNISCPKGMPPDQLRAVRDEIKEKVKGLLASFEPVLQECQ